jgi:hypothetical protein
LYLNVGSRLSSEVPLPEESSMRIDSPSTNVRSRRLRRAALTACTLVAAFVASGAPIHLGMITIGE